MFHHQVQCSFVSTPLFIQGLQSAMLCAWWKELQNEQALVFKVEDADSTQYSQLPNQRLTFSLGATFQM